MKRYAIVTGADRGLGLSLVKGLLQRGYHVIAGKFMEGLSQLDELAASFGEQLMLVELDVSSDGNVALAAERIAAMTESVDVLINNAGILGDCESTILQPLPFAEMQQVFNVNTLGPLRVTNALAPLVLRSDEKMFVYISSEAGSIGANARSSWFGYCMSKAALNMQGALIHEGVKGAGGQVLLLHPGWVQSYMHGELNTAAHLTADESAGHIMERIGEAAAAPRTDKPVYMDYLGQPLAW
ncbi:SDR family oxidoreductase [Paenibacillus sp. R14(2021)]|uniref:SDR family oxidoreductase n=1 Tax=Paenibacillus sp. R14(2021) TaxID=2859228 RepID=UPI001C613BB3|nr:SDR family oxidoreductase [Paenibacillus sp. R14(2021)]